MLQVNFFKVNQYTIVVGVYTRADIYYTCNSNNCARILHCYWTRENNLYFAHFPK